jgi:hypothetical protein
MGFYHDGHYFVGVFLYVCIVPKEVGLIMQTFVFSWECVFARKGKLRGRNLGLLGFGRNERFYKPPV